MVGKENEGATGSDKHNTWQFYEGLWTVYGLRTNGGSPVLSSDGKILLTDLPLGRTFQCPPELAILVSQEVLDAIPQRQMLKKYKNCLQP